MYIVRKDIGCIKDTMDLFRYKFPGGGGG